MDTESASYDIGDINQAYNMSVSPENRQMIIPGAIAGETLMFDKKRLNFSLFGDVVIYYDETMNRGITGFDLYMMRKAYGPQIKDIKSRLTKISDKQFEQVELIPIAVIPRFNGQAFGAMVSSGKFLVRSKASLAMKPGLQAIAIKLPMSDILPQQFAMYMEDSHKATVRWYTKNPDNKAAANLVDLFIKHFDSQNSVIKTVLGDGSTKDGYYQSSRDLRIPTYTPTYQQHEADKGMLKAIELLTTRSSGTTYIVMLDLYRDMMETANTNVLSSGSMSGQLGRLQAGFDTRKWVVERSQGKKQIIPKGCKAQVRVDLLAPQITFRDYVAVLKQRAPFAPRNYTMDLWTNHLPILDLYVHLVSLGESGAYRVNSAASSGDFYNGLIRAETIPNDVLRASQLLTILDEIEDPLVSAGSVSHSVEKILEARKYARLPRMANKLETGSREKVSKKWRNFFVFNAFEQLPASVLYHGIYDARAKLYKHIDNPSVYSLIGWSPYKGGLRNLLTTMVRQASDNKVSFGVYSDNVWCMLYDKGTFIWLSLDGTSMESSITRTDVAMFNTAVLTQFWGKTTKGFARYATEYHPYMVCDAHCLLGSTQFKNIGQFSGTQGTPYFNNSKMIFPVHIIEDLIQTGQIQMMNSKRTDLSDKVYDIFASFGVKIKLELKTVSPLFDYLAMPDQDEADRLIKSLGKNSIIKLDLLAMDAWVSDVVDDFLIFPVLAKDRVLKSLVYNKFLANRKNNVTTNVGRVLQQLRLRALYVVGGFAYPGMPALLRHRLGTDDFVSKAVNTLITVSKEKEIWNDLITDILAEETVEDVDGALKQALLAIGVPYLSDVVKLNVGEEGLYNLNLSLMSVKDSSNRIDELLRVNNPYGAIKFLDKVLQNSSIVESWQLTTEEKQVLKNLLDVDPQTINDDGYRKITSKIKNDYYRMLSLGSFESERTVGRVSRRMPSRIRESVPQTQEHDIDIDELDVYDSEEEPIYDREYIYRDINVYDGGDRPLSNENKDKMLSVSLTEAATGKVKQILAKLSKHAKQPPYNNDLQLYEEVLGGKALTGLGGRDQQAVINVIYPILTQSTAHGYKVAINKTRSLVGLPSLYIVSKPTPPPKPTGGAGQKASTLISVEESEDKFVTQKELRKIGEAQKRKADVFRQKEESKLILKDQKRMDKAQDARDTARRYEGITKTRSSLGPAPSTEEVEMALKAVAAMFGEPETQDPAQLAVQYRLNVPLYKRLKQEWGFYSWGAKDYWKPAVVSYLERNYGNDSTDTPKVLLRALLVEPNSNN